MSTSAPPATTVPGWIELDDLCVLTFRGAAARSFLGRQLTCDIDALSAERPQFGAWLTPKGRVLALLRLIDRAPQRIDAVVPAALAGELASRMRMFVMRDDVQIEIDSEYRVLGAWGECAATMGDDGGQSCELTAIKIAAQPPLALVVGRQAAVQRVSDAHAPARGSVAQWQRLCIEAGLPQVELATREAFIPQMINLDRLGAVSFSKGCYPGQEIVARTQHLGRIKRRMFIARGDHEAMPQQLRAGDVIVAADGKDIGGRVVSVQRGSRDTVLLAVLPLDSDATSAVVRIHDASGAPLDVSAPPYSLTDLPA